MWMVLRWQTYAVSGLAATLFLQHQDIKQLLLKFDDGASDLPLSETCFLTMTIPSKYNTYDEFKKHMDIALKYGSSGFSFS